MRSPIAWLQKSTVRREVRHSRRFETNVHAAGQARARRIPVHARLFRICTRTVMLLGLIAVLGFLRERTLYAFNYVIDSNGTYWGIQDDNSPRVDTGSIRATQIAPGGQNGTFSTSINDFGGIKVLVQASPAPYLNGERMRGFGLTFDGVNRFDTTQSIDLGGVVISRSVYINSGANWGRWLDTFSNTTRSPLTIKVAFGG